MTRKTWTVALLCWFGLTLSHAGSYSVHPVTLELSAAQPATTLKVRNREQSPVTLQLATRKWSQTDGEDSLSNTRDIIAVPPTFTIEPGEEQVVRIGLRQVEPLLLEQAYRVLLQEIPGDSSNGSGLQFALNMSLPLFVKPSHAAKPDLAWLVERQDEGRVALSVENKGTGHFKFTSWRLQDDGKDLGAETKLHYVLPGSRISWAVKPAALPASGDEVDIIVANGRIEQRARALVQ